VNKRVFVLAVLWFGVITAFAQPTLPHSPITPAAATGEALKRETQLAAELRCLVCQNQSIAESSADLALDLRRQIREQIAAGRSDGEIVGYMTARYGDFVMYRPPLKATTVLLWFGPALLLLGGALFAWRVVRARRSALSESDPLSDADRLRAAQLLGP
jgi:cytochrome c-type biogenesis protein CcmH